jgi:hypothetical protein
VYRRLRLEVLRGLRHQMLVRRSVYWAKRTVLDVEHPELQVLTYSSGRGFSATPARYVEVGFEACE